MKAAIGQSVSSVAQSCLTLCDPMNCSTPSLSVHHQLPASFSILSFCLFILFMGFSRQEYWSGLPFSSPVDHILSDLSTMTRPSRVAPHLTWGILLISHSFLPYIHPWLLGLSSSKYVPGHAIKIWEDAGVLEAVCDTPGWPHREAWSFCSGQDWVSLWVVGEHSGRKQCG